MTEHTQHTELIDSYLSGGMTSSEETSFMDLIETDPILKEEFLFQQSIVGGLKEYRKNELKNRLSSISIGVGFFGFLMNASYYKVMAAALTLGIIGYGTYYTISEYFIDVNQSTKVSSLESPGLLDKEVDHPKVNLRAVSVPDLKGDYELIVQNSKQEISNTNNVDNLKPSQSKLINQNRKEVTKEIVLDQQVADEKVSQAVIVPEFNVPVISEEPVEEESLSGLSIDLNNLESIGISESEEGRKIEIEQVKKNNKVRQYKFEEGKLYLYGDFTGDPYELLEINSQGQKRLYFYHHKLYFRLDRYQQSVTEFKQITDKKLIKELEIIRSSK